MEPDADRCSAIAFIAIALLSIVWPLGNTPEVGAHEASVSVFAVNGDCYWKSWTLMLVLCIAGLGGEIRNKLTRTKGELRLPEERTLCQ